MFISMFIFLFEARIIDIFNVFNFEINKIQNQFSKKI